jgi:carotenoid cleavage dioxygenase-like enzyme
VPARPGDPPLADGIIKYDLTTGASQTHVFGRKRFGGEPVFVPRPGGQDEDDGWLVTFVYDGVEGTSELLVLDARDVTAAPVARVLIPQRVPYGFHGAWIDEAQIEEAERAR